MKGSVLKAVDKKEDYAVRVNGLIKKYGDLTAVNGVSITVDKGEVFGLLGTNGAGKTSLIECIEGIRSPNSGEVSVFNKSFSSDKKQVRELMGIQFQSTSFYNTLTVKEILKLFSSFYKKSQDIAFLLNWLDLEKKKNAKVQDLSGGLKQRLSLAVALINDPDLVFLDEPTTGLDPKSRRQFWEIIKEINKRGKTVFLTTHYIEEAEYLCNRVAIMHAGNIIEEGFPRDLVKKHIGEKTIEFSYSGEVQEESISNLPGVLKFWIHDSRVIIVSNNERDTLDRLLELDLSGVEIEDITVRHGNLEDVYLKLTNRGLS